MQNHFFFFKKTSYFLLVLEKYFFKIPKNSIALAFFAEAGTKNINTLWQAPCNC